MSIVISETDSSLAAKVWLSTFALLVREQSYEAAAPLFSNDVVAFGTLTDAMHGRDDLVARQWKNVWGRTRNFAFNPNETTVIAEENTAYIAATWISQKLDASGNWVDRPGRSTFVLRKIDGKWLAVHSHLSLNPSFLLAQESTRTRVLVGSQI